MVLLIFASSTSNWLLSMISSSTALWISLRKVVSSSGGSWPRLLSGSDAFTAVVVVDELVVAVVVVLDDAKFGLLEFP